MVGQHTRVCLRDDFLSRMFSMVLLCSLLLATFTVTLTIAAPDTWSAKAWGDPMITTLDGHTYAFNGKGEYVFINTTDVMIQVRTEYSVTNNTDVTGFTAVAVRTVSSIVELYLVNTTHISVYVNSSRQSTLLHSVKFPEGIVLQRMDKAIINFGLGSLRGSNLQVSASSPKELTIEFTHRGPTSINAHGLAAATTNDSVMMRNGTEVSLNETEGSIYDFGETWGLFKNDSAFNYTLTNKTFSFYNPVIKTRPRFLEELINNLAALFEGQNSSIIHQYNATCRGMSKCLLVIARTGQESEGKRFIQDYEHKKELEKLKSNKPPYFKTTSVPINVTLGETFLMKLSDIVKDDGDFKDLTFSMNESLTSIEIVTGELRWNVTDLYRNHSVRFELTVTDEFNLSASQLFPVTYCGCRNVSQCDYTVITDTDSDNRFARTACRCDETTEGNFCEHDLDPCTKVTCFTNVTCNTSLGFPNPCKTCPAGYTGDGMKCDDIDECLDTKPCSQQCSNSIGSYSCSCISGYNLLTDGTNCTDIDECKYKNTTCTDKTGTTCINIEGSYTCDCDTGFYYDNKKNACNKGADFSYVGLITMKDVKVNTSFDVSSQKSWKLVADELLPLLRNNNPNVTSVEVTGIIKLNRTLRRFSRDTSGANYNIEYIIYTNTTLNKQDLKQMDDKLRIELNNNTVGGGAFHLGPMTTFQKLETNVFSDEDNELCKTNRNDCDVDTTECVGVNGSIGCQCKQGYSVSKYSNKTCRDLDECKSEHHNCSSGGVCQNMVGTWTCRCPRETTLQRINNNLIRCQEDFEYFGQVNVNFSMTDDRPDNQISVIRNVINTTIGDILRNQSLEVLDPYTIGMYALFVTIEILEPNSSDNLTWTVDFVIRLGEQVSVDRLNNIFRASDCNISCTKTIQNTTFLLDNLHAYDGSHTNIKSMCDVSGRNPCDNKTTTCLHSNGTVSCPCRSGYRQTFSDYFCEDIDECSNGEYTCSNNGTCRNTAGNWTCQCPQGYEEKLYNHDNRTCKDIDECTSLKYQCLNYKSCNNTGGSWNCTCLQGYEEKIVNDFTRQCIDVNECNQSYGAECMHSNGTCVNTAGNWTCYCPQGFESDYTSNGTVTCKDIDECSRNSTYVCQSGTCTNTLGSWNCSCNNGYKIQRLNSNVQHCIDLDECKSEHHNCSSGGVCQNMVGTWTCQCPRELTLQRINNNLIRCQEDFEYFGQVNVNFSMTDDHPDNQISVIRNVINTTIGVILRNQSLEDLDLYTIGMYALFVSIEILEPNSSDNLTWTVDFVIHLGEQVSVDRLNNIFRASDCDISCTKTIQNTTFLLDNLHAYDGYHTNIKSMCDVSGRNPCDNKTTTCLHSNGTVSCPCRSGYRQTFSAYFCEDIDECEDKQHVCAPHGECVNKAGTWDCICGEGRSISRINSTYIRCQGEHLYFGHVWIRVFEITPLKENDTLVLEVEIHDKITSILTNRTEGYPELHTLFVGLEITNITKLDTKAVLDFQLHMGDPVERQTVQRVLNQACHDATSCKWNIGYNTFWEFNFTISNDTDLLCNIPGRNPCDSGTSRCKDKAGTPQCDCLQGFFKQRKDVNYCTDVDECDTYKCVNGGCVNSPGSWACQCEEGYGRHEINNTYVRCEDIDECNSTEYSCTHGNCENNNGSWRCTCAAGYNLQRINDSVRQCNGDFQYAREILFHVESGENKDVNLTSFKQVLEKQIYNMLLRTMLKDDLLWVEVLSVAIDTLRQHRRKRSLETVKVDYVIHTKDKAGNGTIDTALATVNTTNLPKHLGGIRTYWPEIFESRYIPLCNIPAKNPCQSASSTCEQEAGTATCQCKEGYNKAPGFPYVCRGVCSSSPCDMGYTCSPSSTGHRCSCEPGSACDVEVSSMKTVLIGVGSGAGVLLALLVASMVAVYRMKSKKTAKKDEEYPLKDFKNGVNMRSSFPSETFPYAEKFDQISRTSSLYDLDLDSRRLSIPRPRTLDVANDIYSMVKKQHARPVGHMPEDPLHHQSSGDSGISQTRRYDQQERLTRMNDRLSPGYRLSYEPPRDYLQIEFPVFEPPKDYM